VCKEIRDNAASRPQEKRELLKEVQEQMQERKTLVLCKVSAPGWTVKVDSELEAKERLYYRHICKTCLQELAYEIDTGERHPDYETEIDAEGRFISYFDYRMVDIFEITIEDLLSTPCGCEYYFGEDE